MKKENRVELNVAKVYKPLKNVYGSEKRPFNITGITKIKFEEYSLTEQKAGIEKYTGKQYPDFVTDSKGLTPTNIVLISDSMRVVVDFGKLLRDDVNNTISKCLIEDKETGKKFYQITDVAYDGNVCEFRNSEE